MKSFYLFVIFSTLIWGFSIGEKPSPLVEIPTLGLVEGGFGESLSGRSFYSFEGVPYARPPVGKYRFRESKLVKPWQGVWKANTIYKCIQYYQYTAPGEDFVRGDEDCLYLNIYTPTLDKNASLDVLVYIHGGAFMFLHGGFQGPRYIMDKDIVYVSLNYRLGPLGFLSTENDIIPGNNGVRDQILALEFIKTNIRHFGGNADSVTIMGMSAGGASIHFHYLSPKSRGLFHRGISQSGTTLNPWVLMEAPLAKTKKLASHLGCQKTDLKQTIECLKTRPARQIVSSVAIFQPWLYNPFSPFGLVVDSWSSDPVLPTHPVTLIKNKQLADLPWLVSYTNSEGLYPASDFYIDERFLTDIDRKWNEIAPHLLDYNYTVKAEDRNFVNEKIWKHYFGEKEISKKTFMDLVRVFSDRMFNVGIQKTVKLQANVMDSPIYFYYFTYRGAHSKSESRSGSSEDFGAAHGDDTSYVFNTNVGTTTTPDDRSMVAIFVELVTSFAKNGVPKMPVEWPPVSKNNENGIRVLKIQSPRNLTVDVLNTENEKFWDSLPIEENEKILS